MVEIIDPNENRKKFLNWKKKGMKLHTNDENKEIILKFVLDMEVGRNVSGRNKGGRGYSRLNAIRTRLPQIANFFKDLHNKKLIDVTRDEVTELFHRMKTGELTRNDGKPYKSWIDYVKDFRAFWRWYMKVQKRQKNIEIPNVCEDVDIREPETRDFVYFTIEELQSLMDNASFKYKVLMYFLFDSVARAPKEAANVRVCDLEEIQNSERLYVTIRGETSKTFERKFKLMLSHNLIKKWIAKNNLKSEDYLFDICPRVVNQYLKRLGKSIFGDKVTKGGKKFSELTMYDFRHSGICYWLPRYRHESALKYRTGHRKSKMLEYYSRFLGMKDTIQEEDLEDVDTRTELQKQLEQERRFRELLQERLEAQRKETEEQIKRLENLIREKSAVRDSLEDIDKKVGIEES